MINQISLKKSQTRNELERMEKAKQLYYILNELTFGSSKPVAESFRKLNAN